MTAHAHGDDKRTRKITVAVSVRDDDDAARLAYRLGVSKPELLRRALADWLVRHG